MKGNQKDTNLTPKKIITNLRKNNISILQVPKKFEHDPQVLSYERKAGLRIVGQRGFDIISNVFFVEESLVSPDWSGQARQTPAYTTFVDFKSFYEYLNGDIYENSCYAYCHLSESTIASLKINVVKLMQRQSFVKDTVDDFSLTLLPTTQMTEVAEQRHRQFRSWVTKTEACDSYDKLMKVLYEFETTPTHLTTFLLFNYIFSDPTDQNRFSIIMKYVSSGRYPAYQLTNALCSIYSPDDVYAAFAESKSITYKRRKSLQDYIQRLKAGLIDFFPKAYFDEKTHYYCEELIGYEKGNSNFPIVRIERYFENFDSFIDYRKGDLTRCDLSSSIVDHIDFSKYKVDQTTKLPLNSHHTITYSVDKWFHNGQFHVRQKWSNEHNQVIKKHEHSFLYFFDFVAFLKGDLSGADLILCDGLKNLKEWGTLNFSGAKLTSILCEKFGLKYTPHSLTLAPVKCFSQTEQNEQENALELQRIQNLADVSIRHGFSDLDTLFDKKCQRTSYISDIHLVHKLVCANCRSEEDIFCMIQKYADAIAAETNKLLLIDGDTSSDFKVFQLFVERLSRALAPDVIAVFTLGNHELWAFPDLSLDDIITKYRKCLSDNGMFLVHNDLLYVEDIHTLHCNSKQNIHIISYQELCQKNTTELFNCLRHAQYTILGSLGFSGYNAHFNADSGLYQKTLNRESDIIETQKFEALYYRLLPVLSLRNTIILTHTPKSNWSSCATPDKALIYVSGHTHRNVFYDDGEQRIYADNQVGYHDKNLRLKSFLLDKGYDCFYDYSDGIHKISSEQYRDFYRGKNLSMTLTRKIDFIYMLKKNSYYCFITETKHGALAILNGGSYKSLKYANIQYYYDHLDTMISIIEKPLTQYTNFQTYIADMIMEIGGRGTIHGCIIDIDFYNHIYINPVDSTAVAYWAANTVVKKVYPSVTSLLEAKRPDLYQNYICFLSENNMQSTELQNVSLLTQHPELYLNTDIYNASREIRKMQKLRTHILSIWYGETSLPPVLNSSI